MSRHPKPSGYRDPTRWGRGLRDLASPRAAAARDVSNHTSVEFSLSTEWNTQNAQNSLKPSSGQTQHICEQMSSCPDSEALAEGGSRWWEAWEPCQPDPCHRSRGGGFLRFKLSPQPDSRPFNLDAVGTHRLAVPVVFGGKESP